MIRNITMDWLFDVDSEENKVVVKMVTLKIIFISIYNQILSVHFYTNIKINLFLIVFIKIVLFFPYKSTLLQFETKYTFCYILKIYVH